ncbi:MAG: hypothetical protein IJD85_05705, partial [Oscillospiraceae bacterium]|nr:hypothetical protein [Oscillospiraceae bacterium]
MDTFSEQIVTRQSNGSDLAKKILISAAAILIASFLMYMSIVYGFLVLVVPAVGVLYGGVWLL